MRKRLPSHRGSFFQPGGAQSPHTPPIHRLRATISAPFPTERLTRTTPARTRQSQVTGSERHRGEPGLIREELMPRSESVHGLHEPVRAIGVAHLKGVHGERATIVG